jgi:uncharacterized repeat protein (TIGR04076 family)
VSIRITVTAGQCQGKLHKVDDVFIVERTTPEGMCLGAWNAIAPYLTALHHGANFPWEKEEGVAVIHCPDPKGIQLELRRVEEGSE